jgi:hypothetical protein
MAESLLDHFHLLENPRHTDVRQGAPGILSARNVGLGSVVRKYHVQNAASVDARPELPVVFCGCRPP